VSLSTIAIMTSNSWTMVHLRVYNGYLIILMVDVIVENDIINFKFEFISLKEMHALDRPKVLICHSRVLYLVAVSLTLTMYLWASSCRFCEDEDSFPCSSLRN